MKKYTTSLTFIITFFALGGLICGYVLSVISGAAPFLTQNFHLTTSQLSMILGIFLIGGIAANIIFLFADKVGRKKLILLTLALYIIGILVFTTAKTSDMLFVGRLIQGVSILLGSMAFTVYLTEIAPSKHRGKIVTVFQLSWTAGMFIATLVNLAFAKSGNWQLMFDVVLFIPVILMFFTFALPPTPRWLALKGRGEEAKELLKKLNKNLNTEALHKEYEMIYLSRKKETFYTTVKSLGKKKYIKPILIAMFVLILNQMTGINAILQASTVMLKSAGLHSNVMSIFGAALISGVNVLLTIGTIIFVDKIGRRMLLKIGTGGFAATMVVMAIVLFVLPHGPLKGWVMLAGLMVGVGFLAFGPCGVIYVVIAEILPNKIRSTGLVIGGFGSMIVGTIFISKFLVFAKIAGYGGLFGFLALSGIIYFIFSVKFVPETNGKTLEEIEKMYE